MCGAPGRCSEPGQCLVLFVVAGFCQTAASRPNPIDGRRRSEVWAIGGVTGAAMVRRAVEPAEILVWSSTGHVAALADLLQPAPARGGRGIVRVAVASDAWTLSLASAVDGLRVADPVQLWLDCASEGERALEAADAVAEVTGW